jgi:uncharacterized protein
MTPDNKSNTSDPEKVPHDHHDIESISAPTGEEIANKLTDGNAGASSADKALFAKALSEGKSDGPRCHEIDMRIARDGSWHYLGSPINRKPLVKLFSTVLRLEDDGEYYLITPVEKARIKVDDVPFTAVEMSVEGEGKDQVLAFRTNIDEMVTIDTDHPLRVAIDDETNEPSPYILVRDNLEALIVRAVFYDLVDLAVDIGDGKLGIWSSGTCFEIGNTFAEDE